MHSISFITFMLGMITQVEAPYTLGNNSVYAAEAINKGFVTIDANGELRLTQPGEDFAHKAANALRVPGLGAE